MYSMYALKYHMCDACSKWVEINTDKSGWGEKKTRKNKDWQDGWKWQMI